MHISIVVMHFYFLIGGKLLYNVVILHNNAKGQNYTYIDSLLILPPLPLIPPLSRSSQNTWLGSLCYIATSQRAEFLTLAPGRRLGIHKGGIDLHSAAIYFTRGSIHMSMLLSHLSHSVFHYFNK